jgi:predicted ribosome quality control (RQC) complex YloA/Tae2 family protein
MSILENLENYIKEFNHLNDIKLDIDTIRINFNKQYKKEKLNTLGKWNKLKKNSNILHKLKQTQEIKELIELAKEITQNGEKSPNFIEKVTKFTKGIGAMNNATKALVELGKTLLGLIPSFDII